VTIHKVSTLHLGERNPAHDSDRYLVVLEAHLAHLDHYLNAISPQRSFDSSSRLEAISPRIVMLVVKSEPTLNRLYPLNPMISICINLYKPVNAHTFLTAATTHSRNRLATFLNAPSRTPAESVTTFGERIERLVLGKNAYISPPSKPIALPGDWQGKHHRDPDFKIVITRAKHFDLHAAGTSYNGEYALDSDDGGYNGGSSDYGSSEEWRSTDTETDSNSSSSKQAVSRASIPRSATTTVMRIEETFKSLSEIIPPRPEDSGLYKFEIACNVAEFKKMIRVVSTMRVDFHLALTHQHAVLSDPPPIGGTHQDIRTIRR
jgi:hypothetical protein